MRLFYYLIAAPALFLLRVLFWPFRTALRCAGWLHRWRKERRRFRRADYYDMDGWEFEEYVGDLLVKDGYIHVEVTRGSGDQGVDVLAERDGVSYAIQCKHYQAKISNKAVQEAYAGAEFYGCDVPVVVTNSYFTPSAEELADEIGVELWDREELNRMVKKSTKSRKNNRKSRRMA